MTKLVIASTVYNGMMHASLVRPLMELGRVRPEMTMLFCTDSAICRGRNSLAAEFLAGDGSHLLYLDHDVGGWRARDVQAMMASELDVVGGIYPIKSKDERYAANLAIQNGKVETRTLADARFARALDLPTGFLLIRRHVLEAMRDRCKEIRYRATADETRAVSGNDRWNFFEMGIDPNSGLYLSEDFLFCRRWQRLGGTCWAALDPKLTHAGVHVWEGDFVAYSEKRGVTFVETEGDARVEGSAAVGLTRQQRRLLERQRQDPMAVVRSGK
jgi:hypothetical protein